MEVTAGRDASDSSGRSSERPYKNADQRGCAPAERGTERVRRAPPIPDPGEDGRLLERHPPGSQGQLLERHPPGSQGQLLERHPPGSEGQLLERHPPGSEGQLLERHPPGSEGQLLERHPPGSEGQLLERHPPGSQGQLLERHPPGSQGQLLERHPPGSQGQLLERHPPGSEGQLLERHPPGSEGQLLERHPPGSEGQLLERHPPGSEGQLLERHPPGSEGQLLERHPPGSEGQLLERHPPGSEGQLLERHPPGSQGQLLERHPPGSEGRLLERHPPGSQGRLLERHPPGSQGRLLERHPPGSQGQLLERHPPGSQGQLLERHPPGSQGQLLERHPPGSQGQLLERHPPGSQGQLLERHPPGSQGQLLERHPPGSQGQLLERHPPGSEGQLLERHPPGSEGQLLERHPPGSDGQLLERHPPGSEGQLLERPIIMRGRRENALGSYRDGLMSLREESTQGGYERAWRAMSGYEQAMSSIYEGSPHPISRYERLSVERAHTMKDFEKQITELKKDNFNLKLRIYFLEEQMQRRCDTSSDELHRMNIELKVEVESLKHDFQEKHNLLVRASKAMESLSGERDLAVQRLREENLNHLQDMADAHNHKIHLLQTEMAHEKAELEKISLLLDQERMQRFSAEEQLLAVNEKYTKSVAILEERDWIIQCLNDTVHSKDALIAQLEKQIASLLPYDTKNATQNISHLNRESNAEIVPEPADPTCNSDPKSGNDENVNEWQQKIKEMDNLINELQQKLEAKKAEEKNSLKRDKAIQGLTLALKKKTKENEKLQNQIENLNSTLSKAQEAAMLQSLKENIHPDYKKLIFTLRAEQDMYSRVLKHERESGGLKKELESIAMLRRWLEESIHSNQELRKMMEAQIMAKYKGDDSMSFLGDQTSYLSICLDHLDQNEYFFAGGPQLTAISKNNMDICETEKVLREEAGTQTQSDVHDPAGGNLKSQQNQNSELSFSERSTMNGEVYGIEAKPTRKTKNTVSTATQTESKTFSDKCFPLHDAAAELAFTLQHGEHDVPSQRPLQSPSNNYEMHGYNQGKVSNVSPNAKKSRIPVLVKSSLNTKLRTEAAKENNHCFEKKLQIENGLLKKIKCIELEEELHKENRDTVHENHIPDRNKAGQEQKYPTEQVAQKELDNCRSVQRLMQEESEIMTTNVSCKESDLYHTKHTKSAEQALKKLKAENSLLSEQLKQAQIEIEAFKAGEELLEMKPSEYDLCTSKEKQRKSSEQSLQNELGPENHRLCEHLKRAQTPTASEDLIKLYDSTPDLSHSVIEHRACTAHNLQAENHRLSEHLKQAQTPTANEDLIKRMDSTPDLAHSVIEHRTCTEQDLQAAKHWLSEHLKRAQTPTANEDLIKLNDSTPDLSHSVIEHRACTAQGLQAENHRLPEHLKLTQIENGMLQASEDLIEQTDPVHGLSSSSMVHMESAHRALQIELQEENDRLSEQLEQARMEIETLKASEELLRCKASELDNGNSKKEEKKSTGCDLQKELQAENLLLSEQLKQAKIKIEILTANESVKHNTVPSLSPSLIDQMEPTDQSLKNELQAENYQLSEQLKTAQMEIEKLLAEKRLMDSSDDSLKLHGSDADDDLSEQSLLDKTITNSVNVIEVDATSDFEDEVCRPSVNSQNAAALRCHHDSHCTECANNRGIISLPTLNSKRASTMHHSSKFTNLSSSRRSFEDTTSLSKYDLLVQSQARELSLQRQKIKESHNLSVICSKNFYNILKAFENLFPASTLDSNISLGFQEQITQTVEWLKELEYKLSDAFYGEEDAYSDQSVDSLLYMPSRLVPGHRLWADKHGCHMLGLVEDYNALRKQILEARNVLQEMESFIDHGVQTAVVNMTEHFENIFFEKLTRTKQSLEEAGCLLKLLWRVSLPFQIHSPYTVHQEEEANVEITQLRKRVVEQEKLLSGMVKRVYSETQMKEDIEKLILDQLAMTHDILKRAKGNLEVQVVDKLQ
ncbi:uncharacterized protein ACNLHF_010635 [Anomaloglossus baeobatrachus]|uniref:uncharacterized protein LOC142292382 n=1 Tax=Anomaloglossus baeobatrachus TaxID=238106 RepID=UPI003F4FD65C